MSPFALRPGVRLALDWGTARIGVAACDRLGTLAYPVETIARASDLDGVGRRLRALAAEYEPVEVVMGLPRHLKGVEGATAGLIRQRAAWVADLLGVDVRLVDERLSTVEASRQLRASGRDAKGQRGVIDQAAAVAILNHALDLEKNTGLAPGERITGRTH